MPAYLILNKFTEQGARTIKDTVNRARAVRQNVEAAGGRVIGIWWTQGQYDSFVIAEVPSEEIGMQLLLAAGMQGNGRSETLRAFSEDEMAQIVAKLP